MQRMRDGVVDFFIFCGLIGFLIGMAAPVAGFLWAVARYLL